MEVWGLMLPLDVTFLATRMLHWLSYVISMSLGPLLIGLQQGIPTKCKLSACVDYIPALCRHRSSLLPIE